MIKEFVCDCLNVSIEGQPDVNQNEVNYVYRLIDSISGQTQNDLRQFFSNSKLIKLKSGPKSVKIVS